MYASSFNWATKNYTESRGCAVVTKHGREVVEIIDGSKADWRRNL